MVSKQKTMGFGNSLALALGVVFLVIAVGMFVVNSYLGDSALGGKFSTSTIGLVFLGMGMMSIIMSYPR